eukprot:s672_g7.t2
MLDLLAKMALYAPESWYEIVTGKKCPAEAKNDYPNIGVAFDASSRLRRAGIEWYHNELTTQWMQSHGGIVPFCYLPATLQGGASALVETKSWQTVHSEDKIPPQPPTESPTVRVVAISDTHLLHHLLPKLPQGDLLIHCGDLGYEESRSQDAREFDEKWQELSENFPEFLKWFECSGLAAAKALRWLGSESRFEHRVLVAGNHDYILECIGERNAQLLCKAFGVDCYLHTRNPPKDLHFKSGCKVAVWGSGVSAKAGVGGQRAIQSGNVAFVYDMEAGESQFREETEHLDEGSADIIVTHGPPANALYGKSGRVLESISELVNFVKPTLFLCGHEHNPDNWKIEQKVVDMGGGTLGVNCACTGRWNQFCGMPFVVDIPARRTADPGPQGLCSVIRQTSGGPVVAAQWSGAVRFDGTMIGITLKGGLGKFFYDRPGQRSDGMGKRMLSGCRIGNRRLKSALRRREAILDMLAKNTTMAMNYTWGGYDENGACNPFPNKYSEPGLAKQWTALIPSPMGKATDVNMTACVADDGSVLEMVQMVGGTGKNWPAKPCEDEEVETLDIYRIFGKGEPQVLSNRDTGDVLGDVSFICTQGSGAEYESKFITHWKVNVSKAFGQLRPRYALCNFNGTANVCIGQGSQLKRVGRRGSQIQSGKKAIGQCDPNIDVGSQYSFPEAGQCPPNVVPSEASGCYWANPRPVRTVAANCVMQDRKLLEVCKKEFGHAPFTESAAIFKDALASADLTKGGCPDAPIATIVDCTMQGHTTVDIIMAVLLLSPRLVPSARMMLFNWAYIIVYAVISFGYSAPWVESEKRPLSYHKTDMLVTVGILCFVSLVADRRKFFIEKGQRSKFFFDQEQQESSKKIFCILCEMVPEHVILPMLKNPGAIVAEHKNTVSILFVMIENFDEQARILGPENLIKFLNNQFTMMDVICSNHQVTKIETVGEEYVCAVGVVPEDEVEAHCSVLERLLKAAADMLAKAEAAARHEAEQRIREDGPGAGGRDANDKLQDDDQVRKSEALVTLKLGMHTGPVVAGVIGQKLPRFRLFGDTVNTAARMMQKGESGCLQFGESWFVKRMTHLLPPASAALEMRMPRSSYLFQADLGDPISCVYVNDFGCMAGTVQGKVMLYNFQDGQAEVLTAFSDEGVRGLYMDNEVAYATLMDLCKGWNMEPPHQQSISVNFRNWDRKNSQHVKHILQRGPWACVVFPMASTVMHIPRQEHHQRSLRLFDYGGTGSEVAP